MSYFNLTRADLPAIRLVNLIGMAVFAYEMPIEAGRIVVFLRSFLAGTLKACLLPHCPFLRHVMQKAPKSQVVPVDWDAGVVKVLTRVNFNDVAMDASKHVFVAFGLLLCSTLCVADCLQWTRTTRRVRSM